MLTRNWPHTDHKKITYWLHYRWHNNQVNLFTILQYWSVWVGIWRIKRNQSKSMPYLIAWFGWSCKTKKKHLRFSKIKILGNWTSCLWIYWFHIAGLSYWDLGCYMLWYLLALLLILTCSEYLWLFLNFQIQYLETSAKQRTNVDKAFHDLVRAIRYVRGTHSSCHFVILLKYHTWWQGFW